MSLSNWSVRPVRRSVSFLRTVVRTYRESNVSFMAGSIAYSAFISLLPLLVLVVLAATAVGGERVATLVVELTDTYLTPTGQVAIVESLTRTDSLAELSILSVVVLLWAVVRLYRDLNLAFATLYRTDERVGLRSRALEGIVVVTTVAVAVSGTISLALVFSWLPEIQRSTILGTSLLLTFLVLAFLPMYYVFPDVSHTVREAVPGAVVAAVGWTVLEFGFRLYFALSPRTELYGVVGAIVLLVTWLYFGSLVLLVGATVNAVLHDGAGPSGGGTA